MSSLNGYETVMAILGDARFTHAEARFLAKAVQHADQHTGRVHLSSEGVGQRAGVKSGQTWAAAITKAHELGYVAELTTRDVIVGGLMRTQKDWSFASSPPAERAEQVRSAGEDHRVRSACPVSEPDDRAYSTPPVAPAALSTPGHTGHAEHAPSTDLTSPSLISAVYGDPAEEEEEVIGGQLMCDRHLSFPADDCPFSHQSPVSRAPEWKQRQGYERQLEREGLTPTGEAPDGAARPQGYTSRRH